MIMGDLLHIFNLGVARHLAACTLKTILQERIIFDGATIEDRLQQATNSLKQFTKRTSYKLQLKKLSRNKLKWQSKKYPELASSGSDCHVVCAWLQDLLVTHAVESYRPMATLLWCGNRMNQVLYASDWFLTNDERESVRTLGDMFLNQYFQLASNAIRNREYMWKVLPKAHILDHCANSPRKVNISRYSTWMDEDFLKKISKVVGLTSTKTAQKRVLQRWLLAMPGYLTKTWIRCLQGRCSMASFRGKKITGRNSQDDLFLLRFVDQFLENGLNVFGYDFPPWFFTAVCSFWKAARNEHIGNKQPQNHITNIFLYMIIYVQLTCI